MYSHARFLTVGRLVSSRFAALMRKKHSRNAICKLFVEMLESLRFATMLLIWVEFNACGSEVLLQLLSPWRLSCRDACWLWF